MRGFIAAVCLLAVLAGTACSRTGAERAAAGAASVAPSPTNSASAVPTPSTPPPLTKADRQRKARAGLIAPDGLVIMGGPSTPKADDDTTDAYHQYCGFAPRTWSGRAHSYRYWAGTGLLVQQQVEGFGTGDGAVYVGQVKDNVAACRTTYQDGDGTLRVVGPVDLGVVGGTDATFAVCVTTTSNGRTSYWCHAYLAHGQFMTYLAVISGPTLESGTTALQQVVLLAAGPLAATDTA